MRYRHSAFSLVEIMIAVAIIALLTSFAISSYRQYVVKAIVSEGFETLQSLKKQAMEHYNSSAVFPSSVNDMGFASKDYTTSNIVAVAVSSNFKVSVTYGSSVAVGVNNGVLFLQGTLNGTAVKWQCYTSKKTGETIELAYLPSSCKKEP